MKLLSNFFDNIGKAITSLAAVIFVMLMTITGMILFSHTLFTNVFPEGMQNWEKLSATWFMALGWEFTVLITTCNIRHINKHVPAIMAICSGIIVLFFIQAFDDQQTALTIVQRWFVGLLAATINFIYAELFYKKWSERNEFIELPSKVNELQSTIDHMNGLYQKYQSQINDAELKVNENKHELNQLRSFKQKVQSELTCPHCKVIHEGFGTLHAHKVHCSSNPRNQSKP